MSSIFQVPYLVATVIKQRKYTFHILFIISYLKKDILLSRNNPSEHKLNNNMQINESI